jgi:hypothetical protein
MRAQLLALVVLSALASQDVRSGEPTGTTKVECDGTTVTKVDAVDNRFDKSDQVPFHGIFEIDAAEARLINGPMLFETRYPAARASGDPTRIRFEAKDGGLTFFRETGRFELVRLKVSSGPTLGQDAMTTQTTSGMCHPFVASHVFDGAQ